MRKGIRVLGILSVLSLMVVPALAGSDFNGTWRLDAQKSWFGLLDGTGSLFSPEVATMVIRQDGDLITVKLFQSGGSGDIATDLNYRTDGSECINELEGYKLTSRVRWEGDSLLIQGELDMSPFYPEMEDRWSISEDGKQLTVDRTLDTMSGGDEQTWVFRLEE